MGICLDTEQNDGSQAFEENNETWAHNSPRNANLATPPAGKFPNHNGADIHFEAPKVPVIFVLGGPGSGKVTHCDNLMQEKRGVTHINMTDLLQQYAIGNDMQDFGMLSSKTVTEVLMLELKMSPNAKTYLVSGYPRNMRDVVEYSEKIQMIQGVILISWRQKILERQIDYGAKLGQVVLSLARMELNNFYKNVIPVAEYFDQSNMLISINGERPPSDVYIDFRSAVFRILGSQDNPPVFANGTVAPVPDDVTIELPKHSTRPPSQHPPLTTPRPPTQVISVHPPNRHSPSKPPYPPVLWVLGGPGSNKAALCAAAAAATGWHHVSAGGVLRAAAEVMGGGRPAPEVARLRERIAAGELVEGGVVMRLLEPHLAQGAGKEGVILDGFPRDVEQAGEFEAKFKQKPTIILLDCSKLQLGRGRLDDSVTAFRRRLEIFRQSSLPMLKAMDNIGRLTIVDGDTDTVPVQEDFNAVIKEHIAHIKSELETAPSSNQNGYISNGNEPNGNLPNGKVPNGNIPNGNIPNGHTMTNGNGYTNGYANGHLPNGSDTQLQDLEDEPIETISGRVANGGTNMINGHVKMPARANGFVSNGVANGFVSNGVANGFVGNGVANGFVGNGLPAYNEVNMDGHI